MKTYYVYILASKRKVTAALRREKQLKKWKRAWKIELIEKNNLQWKDLYETF